MHSKNKDITAEVVMFYTCLLDVLCIILHPFYQEELFGLLHRCLSIRYVKGDEQRMRRISFPHGSELTDELADWVAFYFESGASLSKEVEAYLLSLEQEEGTNSAPSPCYFKYAGDLDALINDIFPFLLEKEMIAKETKKQQLKLIFMGRETSVVIKWTGEKHLLTHLFKQLCDGKNPPLITHPNNRFKWTIVKRNFVDKDGKKLPDDIRSETERTKDGSKALIKLIVEAFRKNLCRSSK